MILAGGHVGVDASCYPTGQVLAALGLLAALLTFFIVVSRCCLAARGSGDSVDADCPLLVRCTRFWGPPGDSMRHSRWHRGHRYQLVDNPSDNDEQELQPTTPRPTRNSN